MMKDYCNKLLAMLFRLGFGDFISRSTGNAISTITKLNKINKTWKKILRKINQTQQFLCEWPKKILI